MSGNKSYEQRKRERILNGNYMTKVLNKVETGEIPITRGSMSIVNILHDDFCNKLKGDEFECNCDPDVEMGAAL
ncbi:MAG: hypothetical protein WCC18_19090 [Candidatus Acidiferrales bacterium]